MIYWWQFNPVYVDFETDRKSFSREKNTRFYSKFLPPGINPFIIQCHTSIFGIEIKVFRMWPSNICSHYSEWITIQQMVEPKDMRYSLWVLAFICAYSLFNISGNSKQEQNFKENRQNLIATLKIRLTSKNVFSFGTETVFLFGFLRNWNVLPSQALWSIYIIFRGFQKTYFEDKIIFLLKTLYLPKST